MISGMLGKRRGYVLLILLAAGSVAVAAGRREQVSTRASQSKPHGAGGVTANVILVAKTTSGVTFGPDVSATMPVSEATAFAAGQTFVVEVWAQTVGNPTGVAAVSLDINYNPAEVLVTNSFAFPLGNLGVPGVFVTFSFNATGNVSVDNIAGKVDDLSGGHNSCSTQIIGDGPTNWARLAVIEMQAVVAGSPAILATGTGNPVFGFAPCNQGDLPQAFISYTGINEPTADLLLNVAAGSESVVQGDAVTVTLDVANLATAINGTQALFRYDNTAIRLESIVPQDLGLVLPDEGWVETSENDIGGDVAYAAIINGGSTSADGTVATLTFTAIGSGTTSVTFLGDNPPSHPTLVNRLTDGATAQPISPNTIDSGNIVIAACDDGIPCTTDTFDGNVCVSTLDAGSCLIGGVCVVQGGINPTNDCEECNTALSTANWSNSADGASCDDGDSCTQTDTCSAGVCTGGNPVLCSASDQCHVVGVCDPGTGTCSDPIEKDGVPCDDSDSCTQTDTCSAGVCIGGNPVLCSALDPCHVAGVCDSGTGICSDPFAADGTGCDDSDPCTLTDSCSAGVCTGGNPVLCEASDQCHVAGVCDSGSGLCSDPIAADGTVCDDGSACTTAESCMAGVCTGGNSITCDPLDQCHLAGTCDPLTGLCDDPFAADGTGCDDGDACTGPDSCTAGVCGGSVVDGCIPCGVPGDCDDGNACTIEDCVSNACVFTDVVDGTGCDDGDLCTLTDSCSAGVCTGSNPVACSASDACHEVGVCDPGTGLCSDPVAMDGTACDDNDGCTQTDTCAAGVCTGGNPIVCTALDLCHVAGVCDPGTGVCSDPVAMDGTACNDNDGCTQTDSCTAGVCIGGNPVVCEPLDQCHLAGVCDPGTGFCDDPIEKDGVPCDDGDLCTLTDVCLAGVCSGGDPVICQPFDQCHVAGVCDPGSGNCSDPFASDGTGCDDSDPCTQTDTCVAGACTGGNPVVCTALDQCHLVGTCDSLTGFCDDPVAMDGTACDDSMFCTTADMCTGGVCGGGPRDCDDLDSCTADSCDEIGNTCVNADITSILLTVEVEALGPAVSVTRDVTVVITSCIGGTDIRVVPVTFDSAGMGSVTLTGVDTNSDWISVSEGHTLSRLLPLVFTGVGGCDATADFIGADRLMAGDFSNPFVPQDNVVDITDFAVLSVNWNQPIDPNSTSGADASGDGMQNVADFTAIQANYAMAGDAVDACPGVLSNIVGTDSLAIMSMPVASSPLRGARYADLNADGVIDAKDVRAFAERYGLRLTREFRAKLRRAESAERSPAARSVR
jgi:Cohesin domain